MRAALASLELNPEELAGMKKGDRRELAITVLVLQRTTVSNTLLAEEMYLGHPGRVSQAWRHSEARKLAESLAVKVLK